MQTQNEIEKANQHFGSSYEAVMAVFSENLPKEQHLARYIELVGDANLPLVTSDRPGTKVELMDCLQRRFNLSLDNRLLNHLFESMVPRLNFGSNEKCPTKQKEA